MSSHLASTLSATELGQLGRPIDLLTPDVLCPVRRPIAPQFHAKCSIASGRVSIQQEEELVAFSSLIVHVSAHAAFGLGS